MTVLTEEERTLRPPLLHRVTTRQLMYVDYVIAILLMLLSLAHHAIRHGPVARAGLVNLVLMIGASACVALRRHLPMTSLMVMAVLTALAAIGGDAFAAEIFIVFPMYQVASSYERRRSLSALAVVLVVVTGGAVIHLLSIVNGGTDISSAVAAVTAWFVGDSVRVRRTYVAGLAEQAEQRQREVVERAQRSLAEERLRIARELHDVVAHSLSVIAVQSGVGRHVIDEQPAQAKIALAAVETTSRSALDELRRMLGVLRHDDQGAPSLTPAPGVGDLEHLADQVRATGVPVTIRCASAVANDLSPSVDLTVFRIVQEALTNVVKHAGPSSVLVEIRDDADGFVVEVTDDGLGPLSYDANTAGDLEEGHHGIAGMRERVAIFGGSLRAGHRLEGGYRVTASFPSDVRGTS
ncbi:MAG: sensor histidine kinase [Acidimicrobiales bacterium]